MSTKRRQMTNKGPLGPPAHGVRPPCYNWAHPRRRMDQPDRQNIVRQLFETTLSPIQLDSYLQRALDRSYWERLNPDLPIGAGRPAAELEAAPLNEPQSAAQLETLRLEGYFQTSAVLRPDVVRRMRLAIERLRAERWPAVFSYVYDDFWQAVRTPSLTRLVSGFLGEGYKQNSFVWTYYVAPVKGAQGWEPHSDSSRGESRLTVWVPLTDATLDNGCMYLIPRNQLPDDLRREYQKLDEGVTRAQLGRLLQSTRALPSPAGAYLGWNHQMIHWGAISSGQVEPRISFAVEFVKSGAELRPDEAPLFDPLTAMPPFLERLRAIGKGLLTYQHNEPRNKRYAELGRLLTSAV